MFSRQNPGVSYFYHVFHLFYEYNFNTENATCIHYTIFYVGQAQTSFQVVKTTRDIYTTRLEPKANFLLRGEQDLPRVLKCKLCSPMQRTSGNSHTSATAHAQTSFQLTPRSLEQFHNKCKLYAYYSNERLLLATRYQT